MKKIEEWKVYSSFKDNAWGADLADMQLPKVNKGFWFLLLLIFTFDMFGLSFWKAKKALQFLLVFKKL